MTKGLSQRVDDSFADEDESYADEFLKAVRETLKDVSDSLTRTTLLVLTLCVVFELLARAPGRITLFGVQFTDPSFIQKLLPVVIAYLFYEQRVLSLKWADLLIVSKSITSKFHPLARDNELDTFLYPRLLALWDIGKLSRDEHYHPSEKFDYRVSSALSIGIVALPVLFQIYAFYRLFSRFNNADALIWLSLILSSFLVISIVVNTMMVAFGRSRI